MESEFQEEKWLVKIRVVAHLVELLRKALAPDIRLPVQIIAAPLPVQLSINAH